jgi:plastocyanin
LGGAPPPIGIRRIPKMVRVRRSVPTLASIALALLLAPAALAKEHKVSIKDLKYNPKELKIKKGDTVVWTNADERDHTVTADDDSFKSRNLGDGDSFTQKFDKPGKYKYHCEYHPRMKATVVVEE